MKICHLKHCLELLVQETKVNFEFVRLNSSNLRSIANYNQGGENLVNCEGSKLPAVSSCLVEPIEEVVDI